MVGIHFAFCFAEFGRSGKGFSDGLAFYLAGQTIVGAMSRLVGLMTTAVGFAASATGGGDRSAAKIGQAQHLLQDGIALTFQIAEGIGHGASP
jgi:hypothetical protein